MKKHAYDLSRFHFLGWLPEPALLDLFRLSNCHFYWTVPFTLSWSLFQAMAAGSLVIGSDSAPVRDAIAHGVSGLLVEPYSTDVMAQLMLGTLSEVSQHIYRKVLHATRPLSLLYIDKLSILGL